jgi:HAD superfamily hydrolase (TIGR01509 family)
MLQRPFDAVVFDLDGVIVDTERPVYEAWTSVLARHGCVVSLSEWNERVGTSGGGQAAYERLCSAATGPVPTLEELRVEIRELQRPYLESMQPMPGVSEWIHAARELGLGLAVASSSPVSWVKACLRTVGLAQHFALVACPDGELAAKPAPDLYLAACEGLGVTPTRAIAVEDSRNGVAAAVAAGMRCLAVSNSITAGMDLSAAHHHIDSLANLPLQEALVLLAA